MLSAFLDEDDQEALCVQTYADCLAAAGNDPLAQQACTREYQLAKMLLMVAVLSLLMTGLNVKSLSLTM